MSTPVASQVQRSTDSPAAATWVHPFLDKYELLLYFGINPLSVVLLAIIFSHSEGCLFTLLILCFAVQKLLSLIRPHLFIFVFISITLGGGS